MYECMYVVKLNYEVLIWSEQKIQVYYKYIGVYIKSWINTFNKYTGKINFISILIQLIVSWLCS